MYNGLQLEGCLLLSHLPISLGEARKDNCRGQCRIVKATMVLKLSVFVVNLLEREDRRISSRLQFMQVSPKQKPGEFLGFPVQYMTVNRHPRGGRYGCYTSHLLCMQKALEDGSDAAVIFEDDFCFVPGAKAKMKILKEDLEEILCGQGKGKVDMLHFGHEKLLLLHEDPVGQDGTCKYRDIC